MSRKEKTKEFRDLLGLQDEVATRVRFALEENRGGDEVQVRITENDRRARYFELKPVLELLTTRRNVPGPHYLAPHTAHYLMETMNFVLQFDPGSVVEYAAAICTAASAMSYQFDSMAISEAVKLVETVLADHKDVLRDNGAAKRLGHNLGHLRSRGVASSVTTHLHPGPSNQIGKPVYCCTAWRGYCPRREKETYSRLE